ncbi:MAG: hypothetical protein ACKVQT_25900 [Burkholderiales bacterium]
MPNQRFASCTDLALSRLRSVFTSALLVVFWSGCGSNTIVVHVPPRVDVNAMGTAGIIEFASNSDHAIERHATRQFQEHVQAGQPGTRFIELGTMDHVLASVGATQLDPETIRKIGAKYGVAAVFVGEIAYSDPKTDIRLNDLTRLQGAVNTEIKGDISCRLLEAKSGASVWSSSAWAKRQLGSVRVSSDGGISGRMSQSNPRYDMVPDMVYHLTSDFRPTTTRQRVK